MGEDGKTTMPYRRTMTGNQIHDLTIAYLSVKLKDSFQDTSIDEDEMISDWYSDYVNVYDKFYQLDCEFDPMTTFGL
jgi:hypothetical protein